jgi:uncharacterized BrkB/YihY/UPF0761 family membrane protein
MVRRAYQRVTDFWWGSGLAYDAPALAFYLLLALAPLALGLSALATLLFPESLSSGQIAAYLGRLFPASVSDELQDLASGSRAQTPWLLLLSAFLMFWTVSAALSVIERAESRIIGAVNTALVLGRIRMLYLGALFTIVLLLIIGSFAERLLPIPLTLLAVPLALVTIALLYRLLPRQRLPWADAFLGALPATAGLLLVPRIVGIYFASGFRPSLAGIFAGLAVFLLSCYLLAIALLVGAGVATRSWRSTK